MIDAAVPLRALPGARAAVTGVAAAVAAFGLVLPLAPSAVAVALAVYALAGWAVLASIAAHPHARFGAANVVTLVRAGGAATFAGIVATPDLVDGAAGWAAAGAASILLALDGADGWLAQRQRLASAFGARFDLETDALTILTLAALVLALGKAGPWVLALGALRYAFVAAGALWPPLARPLPPSARRKAVCVLQVAVLAALLAPPLTPPASAALAALALAAVVWSFAVDVVWLVRARP